MGNHKLRHDPEEHDYDFTVRKTLHIRMWTETHKKLKQASVELKLSMQEIVNELAERVGNGDGRIMQILKEYKKQKRFKEEENLSEKIDMKDLYQVIEDDSPLKKG